MKIFYFSLLLLFSNILHSQQTAFDLIPLGVYGGSDESNLSAYLVGQKDQSQYLCLDAGTLRYGAQKAIEKGTLKTNTETIIKEYIKGYFISHGHLDHVAGLLINSPEDSKKNIYALPFVIDILKKYYFTEGPWINFANEGTIPALGKYIYTYLKPNVEIPVENTNLMMTPFELSHTSTHQSTAALLRHNDSYLLYLGDTGADRVENSNNLENLWKFCAPLIKNKKLKAILIEVSFPNERAEKSLYGHLTPKLLQEELGVLEQLIDKKALQGLNVVITHIKPNTNAIDQIKKELKQYNPYKVNYIFPVQGTKLQF
jgi:cAMP phosphodiesterase